MVFALALAIAFASATQDIAIDAWRIEAAPPERQAAMAATYVFGYRLALLAGGAGALLDGKFLFLVMMGVLQVLVIYLVAWLAFGVDLERHLLPCGITHRKPSSLTDWSAISCSLALISDCHFSMASLKAETCRSAPLNSASDATGIS